MHLRHIRAPWRRTLVVGGLSAALLLLGAGIAAAHVTVSPASVEVGSYPTLTFRVPTESETASTVKVEIQLPADSPFASVRARHTPGWITDVVETPLPAPVTQGAITLTRAVTSVSFTAIDAGIGPDEFATFDLLVGPVPDVASITFVAVQTYSDGSVVTWNEPTPAGGAEPENPAPTITVGAAAAGPDDDHDHADLTATTGEGSGGEAAESHDSDGVARVLAIAGILVALVAIGIALTGRRRPDDSRPPAPTAASAPRATPPSAGSPRPPADSGTTGGD